MVYQAGCGHPRLLHSPQPQPVSLEPATPIRGFSTRHSIAHAHAASGISGVVSVSGIAWYARRELADWYQSSPLCSCVGQLTLSDGHELCTRRQGQASKASTCWQYLTSAVAAAWHGVAESHFPAHPRGSRLNLPAK
eukprot:469272-Rhodomonas_salina.2